MRSRVDPALLSALAVGLVVRLARIARAPLIHPDGPAYLALASDLLHGDVRRVLESYYSPAYPGLVAIAIAAGGAPEVAGRLAAAGAGLAALPLLHTLTRRLLGARAAGVAVLTAALHPALVKAGADVLPETLAGAFLLAWLVVLVGRRARSALPRPARWPVLPTSPGQRACSSFRSASPGRCAASTARHSSRTWSPRSWS